MSEALDFFESEHRRLGANYVLEDGSPESCVEVAILVSTYLHLEGKEAEIVYLTGAAKDDVNFEPLRPLPYRDRIIWGGHTICVLEGVVYDPILEAPEPLESYPTKAFGADILVRKTLFGEPTLYPAVKDQLAFDFNDSTLPSN
jgi:hypothetical protein